jgi:hypothetical protein
MKNIDLTPIFQALILLISSVITIYILPKVKVFLTAKLSSEQMENLKKWVKVAVAAAEQLYGSKKGQEKKEYVVSFLLSKGLVFDVDEVTALIESEVYKLTQGKNYIFAETMPEDDIDNEGTDLFDMCEAVPIEEESEPDTADEECESDTVEAVG